MLLKKLILSSVSAMAIAFSTSAYAVSDRCWIDVFPAYSYQCDTLMIPANSTGHFIHFETSSFVTYQLWDNTTNVRLRSGTAGLFGHSETVGGLYGRNYFVRGKLYAVGWAYINNDG